MKTEAIRDAIDIAGGHDRWPTTGCLQTNARAELAALEAENAWMREMLGFFGDYEAVARHLNRLGWRPPLDAQWTNLKAWCDEITALLPPEHNAPDVSGRSQGAAPADCKGGTMTREALIEQIRNAPEGHLLSLVEWIPVEERLPFCGVVVLAKAEGIPRWRRAMLVERVIQRWRVNTDGQYGFPAPESAWQHITHYAEIPEVSDG